jgi:GNAT superfamily N-acetyltransferase
VGSSAISDDKQRLDLDWIWSMLSTHAYWARWRSREQVATQIESAWRVIGVYDAETGDQIGFCRAVSDGVDFAYLADVIVDPGARGNGVGKALVRAMIEDGAGSLFRWTLFTRDAHDLYEQFGFGVPDETAMVRVSRNGG